MSNYDKVRYILKTGDVIAFSGRGLFSKIIKLRINCPISHVGIVVRSSDSTGLFADSVLLLESTTLTKSRVENKGITKFLRPWKKKQNVDADGLDVIKGVSMRWLSQAVAAYDGDASVYQLKDCPDRIAVERMVEWLREKKFQKTEYDYKQVVYLGLKTKNLKDSENSQLFCSELVGKCLQKMGLLPDNYHPSLMTPKDVINLPIFKHPLSLK